MARDGCTASEAAQKLAAQMSLKAKTRLANRVLDNSGTLEGLASQVTLLASSCICGLSAVVSRAC